MMTEQENKTGRNAPCPCGSGKKYKKCCLLQKEAKLISHRLSELNYNITDKNFENPDINKLPDRDQEEIQRLYVLVNIQPESAISKLEDLVKKYPDIPQLYNYLYSAYISTGDFVKGELILKESYKKNPDYLFSKLNYAEYLLMADKVDRVAFSKVFNNKFDLALLYPERTEFHTTEVVNFFGVLGYYFQLTNQLDKAQYSLDLLQELSPSHHYTKRLIEAMNNSAKLLA